VLDEARWQAFVFLDVVFECSNGFPFGFFRGGYGVAHRFVFVLNGDYQPSFQLLHFRTFFIVHSVHSNLRSCEAAANRLRISP